MSAPRNSAKLDSIDRICDQFESAWLNGETPSIEGVIENCDVDDQQALFEELLILEVEYRIDLNQQPERQDYLDRFTGYAHIVDRVFDRIEGNNSTANTFADDTFNDPPNTNELALGGIRSKRFEILSEHAAGGLGKVFVAADHEVKRNVAVKKLHRNHNRNRDIRQRFQREADITGALEHPGIVPVYSAGIDEDGAPYYAMRFVSGETLQSAIDTFHANAKKERRFNQIEFQKLLRRFIDVCNTIAYTHSKGVVHRDLKPANIILGQFGETQIVDWGMAKRINDPDEYDSVVGSLNHGDSTAIETQAGALMGTPRYMSPEQAIGDTPNISFASDIYSLGATLYHLVTGQACLIDRDIDEVLQRVSDGNVPAANKVQIKTPKPLSAICQKAMQLKPENRYDSAKLLADDVENYLANQPVTAYREPWTKKLARWTGKHKTVVTGTAVALVVLLLSAVVALVLLNGARQRERSAKNLAQQRNEQAKFFFRKARLAVDNYLGKIQSDYKLKSAGLNDLRIELLKSAQVFYTELSEQNPDDPDLEIDVVIALDNLSSIQKDLGKIDQAEKTLSDARELASKLLKKQPGDRVLQSSLVKMNNRLAHIYRLLGKHNEARELHNSAQGLSDLLVKSDPTNNRYRFDLVASVANLGLAYIELKQFEKANDQLIRGEQILADHKWSDYDAKFLQANLFKARAHCFANLNQSAKAIEYYQKSIESFEKMGESYPGNLDLEIELAGVMADYSQESRDAKVIKPLFEKFEQRFEPLLKKHSDNMELRESMAVVFRQTAEVLGESGEITVDEAINLFAKSQELLESIVEANSGLSSHNKALAYGHYRLSSFYNSLGRDQDRESHELAAIELYEDLDQSQLDVLHPQAYCCYSLAANYYNSDQYSKCCEMAKKGIPLFALLRKRIPNDFYMYERFWSFNTVYYLSLWNSGQQQEAIAQLKKTIEIAETVAEEKIDKISESAIQKLEQLRADLKMFEENLSN